MEGERPASRFYNLEREETHGRRGRRPSRFEKKHMEGERPASRFYNLEREENPRTPRPASL